MDTDFNFENFLLVKGAKILRYTPFKRNAGLTISRYEYQKLFFEVSQVPRLGDNKILVIFETPFEITDPEETLVSYCGLVPQSETFAVELLRHITEDRINRNAMRNLLWS